MVCSFPFLALGSVLQSWLLLLVVPHSHSLVFLDLVTACLHQFLLGSGYKSAFSHSQNCSSRVINPLEYNHISIEFDHTIWSSEGPGKLICRACFLSLGVFKHSITNPVCGVSSVPVVLFLLFVLCSLDILPGQLPGCL